MDKYKFEKLIFVLVTTLNLTNPLFANLNYSKALFKSQDKFSRNENVIPEHNFSEINFLLSSDLSENNTQEIDSRIDSATQEAINGFKIGQNELIIESKVQSEKNNILYADGNVIVTFRSNILNADSLIYDKEKKIAYAAGNIRLKINNQLLESEKIEYDFINQKGNLFNVKGLINTENLISDLDFKFDPSYVQSSSIVQRIKKFKVMHTSDKVINWIFKTEELSIDKNKLASKKAFFTNDLLESNQIQIVLNELEVFSYDEKLRLKSKINYLILEDQLSLPFWFGDRTIVKDEEDSLAIQNRWNIGFDNLDKDGFFIGRQLKPIEISKDLLISLEPQFLIQRSLRGNTRSFVQKDYALNTNRVKRDTYLADYFGFSSSLEGPIQKWDIKIDQKLNSFDLDKFPNALRLKTEFNREIDIFRTPFTNRFYGVYRDRIWNGSIGETEIYGAYGWQVDQKRHWETRGVENYQNILFGFGKFKGEELSTNDITSSFKGEVFYELGQKFVFYEDELESNLIDKSYKYVPEPLKEGVFINTKLLGQYKFYDDGNHQEYIGFGLGPEFKFGYFKRDFFDYTRISLLPVYKLKSGESPFKFDNVSEDFTLSMNYDQHLFGPWLLKTSGELNLDSDSDEYGELIASEISLNWQKRSYELGIFYQPLNESGGIMFTLFGFQ